MVSRISFFLNTFFIACFIHLLLIDVIDLTQDDDNVQDDHVNNDVNMAPLVEIISDDCIMITDMDDCVNIDDVAAEGVELIDLTQCDEYHHFQCFSIYA